VNCSLIISVYNDAVALNAVLNSVVNQTWKEFDVIISQDGDSNCFDEILNKYSLQLNLRHMQQADEGFLKNKMLNKVIRSISSEKLVFIDGDCILHPHFMEQYNLNIQEGRICMGRRIDLDPVTTELIKSGKKKYPRFVDMLKNKTTRIEEALYMPWLPQLFHSKPKLLGCNMGWFKTDLIRLNGFDETYINPGYGEDSDIEFRAKKAGMEVFSVRYKAIQFHLDHSRPDRENAVSKSQVLFEERKKREDFRCQQGLEKID